MFVKWGKSIFLSNLIKTTRIYTLKCVEKIYEIHIV